RVPGRLPPCPTRRSSDLNWAGKTGPFAELWQDKPGDIVTLRDNSGVEWRYQVTQVLTLNKDQLPQRAPALFASTGPARTAPGPADRKSTRLNSRHLVISY